MLVGTLPRSTASRVGYHLAKSDLVFGGSRVVGIKLPDARWLVDTLANVDKGTAQGQLKEFAVTSYLALLLFFQKNYLK
jgi:hypothetical protein